MNPIKSSNQSLSNPIDSADDSPPFDSSYEARLKRKISRWRWQYMHLDPWLLFLLVALINVGLIILFSASNDNLAIVQKQVLRFGLGFAILFIFAQIPPRRYHQWAPHLFIFCCALLLGVLFFGQIRGGARRWFDLGLLHLQPSEIMKLALPLMLAQFLSKRKLPPSLLTLLASFAILAIPVLLTIKQPDLGTALIIACSGLCVIFLAGMSWKWIFSIIAVIASSLPFLWHYLHDYQKQRVLTFLNPESDPLGSGYHIIQSKIAIGSGGFIGKGWLNGTQSHLSFLPEHTTDFIFAVAGEEFGLIGGILILLLFIIIFMRCILISNQAQNPFARLLTASLCLTFVLSAFINIGMVIGLLPVVGAPLPLVSYGGSSLLTVMAGFGIIMSVHTHRQLWSS